MHCDPRLTPSAVRERYTDAERWSRSDSWHRYTSNQIRSHLRRWWATFNTIPPCTVLNVGAGNDDLGLCPPTTINVDILLSRVSSLPNPVVGSVEDLPIPSESIDTAICVGSVINYCDASLAVSELARVLRKGGRLILEFESSRSAELFSQPAFGEPVGIIESFYAKAPEVVWAFTPEHIASLLKSVGFSIERKTAIHIVSPWLLLLTGRLFESSLLARLDPLVRHVPFLDRWASNHIYFCKKNY